MSEMTATRIWQLGWRAAIVLVLAAAWSVAGWLLWESRIPGDLDLPSLDAKAVFGKAQLAAADDYERFHRINFLLETAATLIAFGLYAWKGARFARESAAGRIGTGMLLAMLGFALVWLVQLPFSIAGLWWDRRHDVAEYGYVELIFGGWLGLGLAFVFLSVSVLIVMGLAGLMPRFWWAPASAAFVGLATLFAFVYPYTVLDTRPLRDPELVAAAERFARTQGVEDIPIVVEDVDAYTSAANAYAAGLGPSRKVFLWNTLLDGRFDDGQVEMVIAHEFAHHSRDHLWKSLAWYALFTVPGTFLIAAATRRRGGMREPAAMPLALLVLVALTLAATPLENVISRHMEAEADWVALQTTRDPESAKELFRSFADTSLGDPTPPGWAYVLLESHPTLLDRIAMAEAWSERNGTG
jgi:STE24 endopeptidase